MANKKTDQELMDDLMSCTSYDKTAGNWKDMPETEPEDDNHVDLVEKAVGVVNKASSTHAQVEFALDYVSRKDPERYVKILRSASSTYADACDVIEDSGSSRAEVLQAIANVDDEGDSRLSQKIRDLFEKYHPAWSDSLPDMP